MLSAYFNDCTYDNNMHILIKNKPRDTHIPASTCLCIAYLLKLALNFETKAPF